MRTGVTTDSNTQNTHRHRVPVAVVQAGLEGDEDVGGHGGALDLVVQRPAHQAHGNQLLPVLARPSVEQDAIGARGLEVESDLKSATGVNESAIFSLLQAPLLLLLLLLLLFTFTFSCPRQSSQEMSGLCQNRGMTRMS